MNRDTAPRIISPPFPRYKRAFSIAGTTSASAICFSAQDKAPKLKTQIIKHAVPTPYQESRITSLIELLSEGSFPTALLLHVSKYLHVS